ncbi:MAG TPA: type II 3-dehydroquinate dehydratase [Flavobacteriales bacterium]|nr:type II 3-dehydroquinate dehydratase [Flavobacteriales bacterium]|tara:strand:+ start:391 stop:825 length:435 start_codon:yes stop_codon:yes gene_type:complete
MSKRILLLHGPNLNLLGQRDVSLYGALTLPELENAVRSHAEGLGGEVISFQSNVEGELVNALHESQNDCIGVIFNPGGYSHTSVALRDAVDAISIPTVEVHLSNIHARETFRQKSLTAQAAKACVSGLGAQGYFAALDLLFTKD